MKPILTMVLSTLLIAWSFPATPLGLGEIDVRSHLGQRFDARIPITTTAEEAGAAKALTAKLAGADEYTRAGLELSAPLKSLSVSVQAEPTPVIVISSSTPINEPYLEIIVDADSNGQKLLRNYTVLLDPVVGNHNAVPPPAEPAVPAPPRASTPTVVRTEPFGKAVITEQRKQIVQKPIVSAGPGPKMYGPVKARETLQSIALLVRPDNRVMIDQTMYAIYKANPQVFSQGLYSRLSGRMLRVPTRNEITAVSAELAQAQMTRLRESGAQGEPAKRAQKDKKDPKEKAASAEPAAETPVAVGAQAPAAKPAEDKPTEAAVPAAPAADTEKTLTSEAPKVSIYGPVKAGDTLWSIAARMNPDPAIPVHDVLKAIHKANPRAFDGGINGLMKGATLRIPDADEIRGRRKEASPASAPAPVAAEPAKPVAAKPDIQPLTSPAPVSKADVEPVKPAPAPGPDPAPAATPAPAEAPAVAPAPAPTEAVTPPAPAVALAENDKEVEKPRFEIRLPKMLEGFEGLKGTDWVDVLLLPLVLITLVASAILWIIAIIRRWIASKTQPSPWTSKSEPAATEPHVEVREPLVPGPFVEIPLSEQTEVPLPEPEPVAADPTPFVVAALPPEAESPLPVLTAAAAIKPAPTPTRLSEDLADVEVNMAFGFYAEAIPVLERLHAEQPANLDITRKLAKALLLAGRRDEFERLVPPPVEPRLPPEPITLPGLRSEPPPPVPAAPPAQATPVAAPIAAIAAAEEPPLAFTPAPVPVAASWTELEPVAPVFSAPPPAAIPERRPAPVAAANWAEEPAFQLDDFELDIPAETVEAEAFVAAPPRPAAPAAPPPAPADRGMIEFDLSEFDLSPITDAPVSPAVDPFDTAGTIDFMLSATEPVAEPPAPPAAATAPGFESIDLPQLDEFDLDLEADGHQAYSGDESGTKLDLARAYIEMGDNEMARSLLNEVLQNGNDGQRNDARGLLGRLG